MNESEVRWAKEQLRKYHVSMSTDLLVNFTKEEFISFLPKVQQMVESRKPAQILTATSPKPRVRSQ